MFGPMSVASSRGSPWRSAAARAVNRAVNSSAIASSTSSLVPARHTCPALSNWPTACPTARSRSASANTSNGDFPPSSSETGVSCPPAAAATCRPVAPEPVKATRATPGCATSGAPASAPRPWTTLNTPSGRPASRVMSASRLAVSGAHSGGLATTVFPAASAGAMRQVASINGAFHGVITAVTPDGSQETRSACPETSRSPGSRRPSQSAKNSKLCATLGITLRRCERSREPLSRVSTCARSSIRARTPAAIARNAAARSGGGAAAQPLNAARAALTAASTSAAPPRAISAMTASSIGDTSVNVAGEATLRPPIQWRVSTSTPATRAVLVGKQITTRSRLGPKYRSGLDGLAAPGQYLPAVPADAHLAVVAGDDLADLQPGQFLGGRVEQVQGGLAAPGGPGFHAGAARGDQLVKRVGLTLLDRGHPPVVRHRVGVDEPVVRPRLAQRHQRLGEPAVGGGQRAREPPAGRDPRRRAAERVRPGLVDRPEFLGVALVQAAHQGEIGVDPDIDAARVDPPGEAAPHDGEALAVLGPDRIQQLLAGLAARLPVGPDQRDRAGVVRGGHQRG